MNITCATCGVAVDHASPGCAEHARREAAEIHRAHVASGGSAEHCPVCARPAAANRAERRQGMGAEVERLTHELARVRGLLDDVAHAHERDLLAIWKALGETHEPPQDVAAIIGRVQALRGDLDRAHHTLREHGPRCSHPACDELAPYRCDDCGERFCADHDDGCEGHDPAAGPMPHAVGPDDLRAGAAMREAGAR